MTQSDDNPASPRPLRFGRSERPLFQRVFDMYLEDARKIYDARIAVDPFLAPLFEGDKAEAWREIVEEEFRLKIDRHLPGQDHDPDDYAHYAKHLQASMVEKGLATDASEAKKLHKTLGRYARTALRDLQDRPEETSLLRPRQVTIDHDGTQHLRGARGRFRSNKSRQEQDLNDGIGDMKRAWADRLRDGTRDAKLHDIFDEHEIEWKSTTIPFHELDNAAAAGDFTTTELLAAADERLAAMPAYKLKPFCAWPDKNAARHADVATYIDQEHLWEPLTKVLLLQRVLAELRPLVWELGEEYRLQSERVKGYSLDEQAVEDRLYGQLEATLKHVEAIARHEQFHEDEISELEGNLDDLFTAATASIHDYVPAVPRGESQGR